MVVMELAPMIAGRGPNTATLSRAAHQIYVGAVERKSMSRHVSLSGKLARFAPFSALCVAAMLTGIGATESASRADDADRLYQHTAPRKWIDVFTPETLPELSL